MKKTKFLALILCLSFLCTLLLPATAYADDPPADSGMKISKTATANKDGSYTITLEAFATGSQTTSTETKDVPTDIILVLDQSGSMADDIGQVQYTAYTGNNTQNKNNYGRRHNGGSANLWHKLKDGSFVSVSVTLQQTITYNKITKGRNDNGSNGYTNYWNNRNNLYTYVRGEIKKVVYTRERDWIWENYNCKYALEDGTILNQNNKGSKHSPTFQNTDDGYLYLGVLNENQNVYIYTYTDSTGATQTIGTSTGANTSFKPAFYQRSVSTSGGGSRLNALKNAVTAFSNAVAVKAAGADGELGTTDDVHHRIAVVGYASRYDSNKKWKNTEVFVGASQYNYNVNASQYYNSAFQDMSTTAGKTNITASIGALDADGATYTNYGLEMANGILNANPVPDGETRNRVIVLFTDGYPGKNADDFNVDAANAALAQATTAKNNGVSLYSVGIFSGADATTAGNYNGSNTDAANWFMQQVSSNNGTPRYPSYYLSAGDAASLNSIFQQISNNITTGGSSTTLGSETVVKDIISPYFTLPAGTTARDIQIDTYECKGKKGDTYTWSGTSSGNGGATATVDGDQVSVTGFDFSKNWCGTETDAQGETTVRGKKLVISFKVDSKAGFLGGNDVPTNASAGIYENGSAQTPVITFERPTVNVPIQNVTVTAEDKNVYLLGEVTADQLKTGATVKVGDVTLDLSKANDAEQPYGLEPWQTEFVNITVAVKDKATGNEVTDFNKLEDDKEYTITVTVSPKVPTPSTTSSGTAAVAKDGSDEGKINVFKPELTFKDSTAYYGESVPTNSNYSGNKVGSETWKHGDTVSTDVTMLGTKPTLDISYTPDESKLESGKYTKQDVPVAATVKIGTESVNEHTTFVHQACTGQTCTLPEGKEFLIHVKTCRLNITKQGGAANEPYVFTVKKDGQPYTEVTIVGNDSVTIYELPVGDYTIEEDTGWSWRYSPQYSTTGAALSAANPNGTITCTNKLENNYWLNGFSQVVKNIFRH